MEPRKQGKDTFNEKDHALTSTFNYSPAHVAVLHRRYDTLGFRRFNLDEKRERAHASGGYTSFERERGAKAVFYHRPGHRIRHQLARHHSCCLYVFFPLSVLQYWSSVVEEEHRIFGGYERNMNISRKDGHMRYTNNTTDLRSLLNSRRVQERPPQPGPQDCHQAPLNAQPWVFDWTTSGVSEQD